MIPSSRFARFAENEIQEEADNLPITFLPRDKRYVEKLATPDVTIADIIGDLDPIKAAKHGRDLSAHENIHFGLLPRAHRGIFVLNELPDLAPKIQVGPFQHHARGRCTNQRLPDSIAPRYLHGLFSQPGGLHCEGKNYYTFEKIRIGSEVKTHYPYTLEDGIRITLQESWLERNCSNKIVTPEFITEIIEGIAFHGRQDQRIDQRSGISQRLPISCLEVTVSNAEQRALSAQEDQVVPRPSDGLCFPASHHRKVGTGVRGRVERG